MKFLRSQLTAFQSYLPIISVHVYLSVYFSNQQNKPQDFGVEHFQFTNINHQCPQLKKKNSHCSSGFLCKALKVVHRVPQCLTEQSSTKVLIVVEMRIGFYLLQLLL